MSPAKRPSYPPSFYEQHARKVNGAELRCTDHTAHRKRKGFECLYKPSVSAAEQVISGKAAVQLDRDFAAQMRADREATIIARQDRALALKAEFPELFPLEAVNYRIFSDIVFGIYNPDLAGSIHPERYEDQFPANWMNDSLAREDAPAPPAKNYEYGLYYTPPKPDGSTVKQYYQKVSERNYEKVASIERTEFMINASYCFMAFMLLIAVIAFVKSARFRWWCHLLLSIVLFPYGLWRLGAKGREEERKRRQAEYEEKMRKHGSARWGTLDDLMAHDMLDHGLFPAALREQPTPSSPAKKGMIIGYDGQNKCFIRYPKQAHLLTIASTGSGKGVGAVIPNLLDYPDSLICIDPKGENAAITARYRHSIGHEVHILDPWGIAEDYYDPDWRASFNPLALIDADDVNFIDLVDEVAQTLIVPNHKKDSHWDNEARSLITGLLVYIVAEVDEADKTIPHLYDLLSFPPERFQGLFQHMLESYHPEVRRSAGQFLQKSEKEAASVVSTAQSHLHFLRNPQMRKVLSHSSFDLSRLKKKYQSIYLILPADKLDSHGRWLRLMVGCTIRAVIQDKETQNNKVLFLLDEFAALGYMPIIKKAMGIIRGYGMMIWPILQNLSQLKSLYPDDYETFIANADVLQVFGVNDFTTAEYISKTIGTTTIETLNENRNQRDGNISNGESHGLAGRLLIMPDEVMKITDDQMLLLTSQQNPYKVLKPVYYKLSYLRQRSDLNPYHDH